ncbi:MAG: AAA family ATPase [Candidatus Sumerlaeota bacterium]|nr:AAA family ATPase [Candidatus Sumerlaeota bacterium]
MSDLFSDSDQENHPLSDEDSAHQERSASASASASTSSTRAPDFHAPHSRSSAVALYDLMHPISGDRPLADRMRPHTLEDFLGQEKLIGPGALLRRLIERDDLCSMIFWGPPGSGKTTLATIIARASKADFIAMSAVAAGVKDVKAVIAQARKDREQAGSKTILFID